MQLDRVVPSVPPETSSRPVKASRWDKKIASVGFGVALLLAILCFATLMASNQRVDAQVEHPENIPTQR